VAITEKRCRGCAGVKPADEFWRNRSKPDGLQDYCKPCHREKIARSIERRGAPYPNYRAAGQPPRGPVSPIVDGMKPCRKCGVTKPVGEFYRAASVPGGLQYWCKDCQKAKPPPRRGARARAKQLAYVSTCGGVEGHAQTEKVQPTRFERVTDAPERAGSALEAGIEPGPQADIFICERGVSRTHCVCGVRTRLRCGFPDAGSTCSEPLCVECGHEIRPGLLYCEPHHERAQDALAAHRRRMEAHA
jgi:hypothetical protein